MARARGFFGGIMYRTSGLILAGVFVAFTSETRRTPIVVSMLSAEPRVPSTLGQASVASGGITEAQDITALLSAARGVPSIICAFAAQSVGNGGWGWYDAPASPVASETTSRLRD